MSNRLFGGIVLAALMGAAYGYAQQAAAPRAEARSPAQQPSAPQRDPFRSLIVRKPAEEAPVQPPPGKRGLIIGQLQVQGIIRGINGEWLAVVDNKTKRAYFLREKEELFNGVVSRITADGVVFEERMRDSFGRERTREVVKQLPSD